MLGIIFFLFNIKFPGGQRLIHEYKNSILSIAGSKFFSFSLTLMYYLFLRSEIHREIPAFIGLSPSPPPLHLDNLHIGTNFQGTGRSSNGLGSPSGMRSPNILPTAPKPTSNLVKPAKLFNNQNGGGLNGTERNGVVENVGHGGQFNGSAGSNKTDNGQVNSFILVII